MESQCRRLSAIELRYVLTHYLFHHGRSTIAELVRAVADQGFSVTGRPSKTISDVLRSECARARVFRLGRGRYAPGWMPRSTENRIHRRVLALRAEVRARPPGILG